MNAAYLALVALPAAFIAFILEARRKKEVRASRLPFTWGYFVGMSGFLMGLYCALFAVYAVMAGDKDASVGASVFLFLAAVWGPAGFYAMKRRKWAWVLTTILSCNPVWWIANTVYGRNRWHEFEGGKARPVARPVTVARPVSRPATVARPVSGPATV